ncbi:hypothetical protein ACOSQ2_004557 [Xanthoceras sorbifolium]
MKYFYVMWMQVENYIQLYGLYFSVLVCLHMQGKQKKVKPLAFAFQAFVILSGSQNKTKKSIVICLFWIGGFEALRLCYCTILATVFHVYYIYEVVPFWCLCV